MKVYGVCLVRCGHLFAVDATVMSTNTMKDYVYYPVRSGARETTIHVLVHDA